MQRQKLEVGGRELILEVGRMAKQANGSAVVTYAGTTVLSAVVMGSVRDFGGDEAQCPLMVDYRERTYAAGKFPGGFYKREGAPSTKEILSARLIDRPLRPLFPDGYVQDTQVHALVLSADGQNNPDIVAMNAASLALHVSDIPHHGPTAAVRIARAGGEWRINPTADELKVSDVELVVAGTRDAVTMVEGSGHEVPEADFLEAIALSREAIRGICDAFDSVREAAGKPKVEIELRGPAPDLIERIRRSDGAKIAEAIVAPGGKLARGDAVYALKKAAMESMSVPEGEEGPDETKVRRAYSRVVEEVTRERVLSGRRVDGRTPTDIRPISIDLAVLPRTHGSALFTRGETQSIGICVLGTSADRQRVDGLEEEYKKRFYLHYYFPPFSVGEIKPVRGPGRREIGHGDLAERSLYPLLPSEEEFPYTIRVVSEILESNGSSSMASVCSGSLAMMDAGVSMKGAVAGIAMGLVQEGDRVCILSDILGGEDKYGDMDFKVAGTEKGITGFQMDLKTQGISPEIMARALSQAREGRLAILAKMREAIEVPRADLSPHAPRLLTLQINPEKIGLLIGPGGRVIRKIEEDTGANVEVDDTGRILVSSKDLGQANQAVAIIQALTEEIQIGKTYKTRVASIKDFGIFATLPNGQDGMCHISELSEGYLEHPEEAVHIGDELQLMVLAVDEMGKIRLSRKAVLQEERGEPVELGAAAPRRDSKSRGPGGGGRDRGRGPGDRPGGGRGRPRSDRPSGPGRGGDRGRGRG